MMIQKKLITLRKERGMSQEKMAQILSTAPSNYSRKERGEIRIHNDEWQKLAVALNVSVEDIKEEKPVNIIPGNQSHNDNHEKHFNMPVSAWESLQDYIQLLKKQIASLQEENSLLKSQDN